MEIRRISPVDHNHYLFGFHDLVQSNAKGDMVLALQVDDISTPPLPGSSCNSGVIDLQTHKFVKIHSTRTWNYPQGARQQWIGGSDIFVCNDREPNGKLVSRVVDARERKILKTVPFPIHCLTRDGVRAMFVDYDRLYAVGGYGYTPLNKKVIGRIKDISEDDGLWIGDLRTGKTQLIASLLDVARCGEPRVARTGYPHYVTHPMLNPSGTRVAFLHQYRVRDGGDISRILVCDLDGHNMICLAKGLVSHFTWINDSTIFGWGGDERRLCKFRESRLLAVPGMSYAASLAKSIIRYARNAVIKRDHSNASTSPSRPRAFMLLTDKKGAPIGKSGLGILVEDGHPMARPGRMTTVVCDTYPNASEERQLFLYDVEKSEKRLLGMFGRLMKKPDLASAKIAMAGVDPRIRKAFGCEQYMFTRSGLHCDLHPRWAYDGSAIYFDSTQDGSRAIYSVTGLEDL